MIKELFLTLLCAPVLLAGPSEPDLKNDVRWSAYVLEDGNAKPNNVVAFYAEFYPDYYDANTDLMAALNEQYVHHVAGVPDDPYFAFDSLPEKTEERLWRQCVAVLRKRVSVMGTRRLDANNPILVDRLYRWYNFGYGDGFHNDFFSDDSLLKEAKTTREKAERAVWCVECLVPQGREVNDLKTVLYFDEKLDFLFGIDVCQ